MSISTVRKIVSINSAYEGMNWPDLGLPKNASIIGIRTDYVCCYIYDETGEKIGEEMKKTEIPVIGEDFELEPQVIFLFRTGNLVNSGTTLKAEVRPNAESRSYYSIHPNYTMDILRESFYVPDIDAIMDPDNPEQERYAGDLNVLSSATEEELFDIKFETEKSLLKSLGENYCFTILSSNIDLKDKYLQDSEYLNYLGISTTLSEQQENIIHLAIDEKCGSPNLPPPSDPKDLTNFTRWSTTSSPE